MKNCTYDIVNGEQGLSLIELLRYVDKQFAEVLDTKEKESINDIVYSKNPLRDSIITKIGEVKHDYIITSARTVSTYDDELGGDGNTLSYQEFIEDPSCLIDGMPLVRPFNRDEFRDNEIDNLVKNHNYSKDKATAEVDADLANMDKFKDDSVILHRIIDGYGAVSTKVKGSEYIKAISDVTKGTVFDGRTAMLEDIKGQMENFVNQYIYRTQVGPTVIGNVGLKAKIEALGKE